MPPKISKKSSKSKQPVRKKRNPPSRASSQGKKSSTSKPFKVCDISRANRKGIVASSLTDMRTKVAVKFDIKEDFDIVLEDDCTVIGDEEYFDTLNANTLLMVLKGNERVLHEQEEIDTAETDEYPGHSIQDSSQLARIASKLSKNLSALVTLPDSEAQVIAEADRNQLHVLLRQPMDIVRDIQHTCIQRLNDRQSVKDAVSLLSLYHRAKSQEDGQGDGNNVRSRKRRRMNDET